MSGDAVETYVLGAAALAGLELDEESLKAVTANTRILQALYAQFADLDLPEGLDPATVLRL
ncbi:MAG: AtzG-like protein [Caulobacteraceae bacterium]